MTVSSEFEATKIVGRRDWAPFGRKARAPGRAPGLREAGVTLIELLVGTAVGSLLLIILAALTASGERSFAVMANYTDLDGRSRNAANVLSRELRQASQVLEARMKPPEKSLTFWNPTEQVTNVLTWDEDARTLILATDGQTQTLLRDCDRCEFALYSRAPVVTQTNISFVPAPTLADCKLIEISWSCSRTVLGKTRTETAEKLRIDLRNKVR